MRNALHLFEALIDGTNNAASMYSHFCGITPLIDCTDLLRWQWIQAVSSLDKFIHDIIRIGMLEIFNGNRLMTNKYKDFAMNLELVHQILNSSTNEERMIIIDYQIMRLNGFKSFQKPKNISDALSYIWDEKQKWKAISNHMTGMPQEELVKTQLNNVSIRRDQIAHEGDCQSNLLPITRQAIEIDDVNETIAFIKDVAQAIYCCITSPDLLR